LRKRVREEISGGGVNEYSRRKLEPASVRRANVLRAGKGRLMNSGRGVKPG
jgi:hypothetical protein